MPPKYPIDFLVNDLPPNPAWSNHFYLPDCHWSCPQAADFCNQIGAIEVIVGPEVSGSNAVHQGSWNGGTPMDGLSWKMPLKWILWGYLFRKPTWNPSLLVLDLFVWNPSKYGRLSPPFRLSGWSAVSPWWLKGEILHQASVFGWFKCEENLFHKFKVWNWAEATTDRSIDRFIGQACLSYLHRHVYTYGGFLSHGGSLAITIGVQYDLKVGDFLNPKQKPCVSIAKKNHRYRYQSQKLNSNHRYQ